MTTGSRFVLPAALLLLVLAGLVASNDAPGFAAGTFAVLEEAGLTPEDERQR